MQEISQGKEHGWRGGRNGERNGLHLHCRDSLNNDYLQKVNQTIFQRTKVIDTYLIMSIKVRDSLNQRYPKEKFQSSLLKS